MTTWKSLSAAAVQLAIAPLSAGRLQAVRALPGSLTMRLMLRIQLADVAAAVGQQQVGAAICADQRGKNRPDESQSDGVELS